MYTSTRVTLNHQLCRNTCTAMRRIGLTEFGGAARHCLCVLKKVMKERKKNIILLDSLNQKTFLVVSFGRIFCCLFPLGRSTIDSCDIVNGRTSLILFILRVQANKVLLRMTRNLSRRPSYHKVS